MDPSNLSNVSNITANVSNLSNGPSGTTISDVLAPLTNAISPFTDIIMTQPGVNDTVSFSLTYLQDMPYNILVKGDVAALVLAMILFYLAISFVNFFAKYLLSVVKNLMILTIIGAAFYTVVDFFLKGLGPNPDPLYIVFGIVGIAVGFIAVLIAIYFVLFHTHKGVKEHKQRKAGILPPSPPQKVPLKPPAIKDFLSVQGIKKGKHTLTTMLIYILIAEFGVFSSVTVSAPSVPVGIGLLVAFFLGVSVYIFRTYPHPIERLKLLLVASVVGFFLSVILGAYWASIPMELVLSPQYFVESTLVAFLTGIALSLFMAGKELQEE